MSLAKFAGLGIRALLLDFKDETSTLIVRRRLLRFVLNRGLRATKQTELSDPDCAEGWIRLKHARMQTLYFRPRRLRIEPDQIELEFDANDERTKAATDGALVGAASAAMGGLLLLVSGGALGGSLTAKGITLVASAGIGYATTDGLSKTGSGLVARWPVDDALRPSLVQWLGGDRIELLAEVRGSDLHLRSPGMTASRWAQIREGIKTSVLPAATQEPV